MERALSEEPRPGAERKLTGKEEALATACAGPPKGRARWTLELLAGAMVIVPGARSKSSSAERQKIMPTACATSSISIVPMPGSSGSSRIIYRPTRPAPSMRLSRQPKPGGSCDGFEFHYTPKHASWLNMVEIEIGVLRGQCLDRRIDDPKRLAEKS